MDCCEDEFVHFVDFDPKHFVSQPKSRYRDKFDADDTNRDNFYNDKDFISFGIDVYGSNIISGSPNLSPCPTSNRNNFAKNYVASNVNNDERFISKDDIENLMLFIKNDDVLFGTKNTGNIVSDEFVDQIEEIKKIIVTRNSKKCSVLTFKDYVNYSDGQFRM